jgi:hypothetical protein
MGRRTPVHFFLQLEPSLFLSGQTTSLAGSEKWPAGGGMVED